jgi:hypothetical protein
MTVLQAHIVEHISAMARNEVMIELRSLSYNRKQPSSVVRYQKNFKHSSKHRLKNKWLLEVAAND